MSKRDKNIQMENIISIIEDITKGIQYPIAASLKFWCANCQRFEQFVKHNESKIKGRLFEGKGKKKKPKPDNDLKGVEKELWVAYLILSLDSRFSVEYEKYKKKVNGQEQSCPDLTVTFQQSPSAQPILFNIEVTQFCLTNDEVNYYNVKKEIVKRVKAIPSGLKFTLTTISQDENSFSELGVQPDFVSRLISEQESIIQYIQDVIQTEKQKLSYNTWVEYPIPRFKNDLYLCLYKPSKPSQGITPERTGHYEGFDPILYTQNEYEKIVRKILKDKLKQMIENTINLLVIISDSPTYDVIDFEPALGSIRNKVIQKDNDFFINEMDIEGGISEFLERYKRLSGLLFIDSSKDDGILLCNNQSDVPSR